jgi:F-type H+-transporting ATPase subunit gamma
MPRRDRRKVIELFEAGEFDVATLFYSRFKSVIAQIPTAQQIIRRRSPGGEAAAARRARRSTNTSPDEERSSPTCCRATSRADLPRAARERRVRAGRAHVRDGQCDAQRRRDDQEADAHLQPHASGEITKELIEIISGAEAL